jgi:diguanylate cyclase (GGDEF)-like protein/PAS domain S-box-containing protein
MIDVVVRVSRLGLVLECTSRTDAPPPADEADPELGRPLAEWVGPRAAAAVTAAITKAADGDEPVVCDWCSDAGPACGYWLGHFVRTGIEGDVIGVLHDITRERGRDDADELVSRIEQQLTASPGAPAHDDVLDALRLVVEFVGGQEAGVVVIDRTTNVPTRLYEWTSAGELPEVPLLEADETSWLTERLPIFEAPLVVHTTELPAETRVLRRLAQERDIASVGLVPMVHDGATVGMVGIGFPAPPDRIHRMRHASLGGLGRVLSTVIERHRREVLEQESSARFESLVERNRDLIAVVAADGRVQYVSPASAALAGYSSDEYRREANLLGLISPDDRGMVIAAFSTALAQPGEPVPVSFDARGPNGTSFQIVGTFTNLLEVAGVEGIVLNARDVTEERAIAEALERRKQLDTLASEISRELLSVPSEAVVDAIGASLGRVARHLGADAATLGRREDDGWFRRVCIWHDPDVGSVPGASTGRVPPDAFPWVFGAIASGEAGVLSNIEDLPPEAVNERARMERLGARSAALVSVTGGGKLIAYVNFYWRAHPADERAEMVAPLRSIGELLTAAYDRAHADLGRRAADERQRSVFEALGEAILVTDATGAVVTANPAAVQLFGRALDELVGSREWWSMMPLHEDGTPYATSELATVATLRDGRPRDGVLEGTAAAAGRRWLSVNTRPIGEPGQAPSGVVTSFTDVTARVESEELKSQLAMIVESSRDAIISTTLDGTVVSWNSGAERLYGHTAQEAVGRDSSFLTPDGYESSVADIAGRLLQGDHVEEYETVRLAKDGTPLDVSITVSAIRNGDGQMVGASAITRDITEQKRAEADRRRADARFRSLIEHGSEGILVFDPDGIIVFASPAVEGIYGYTPDELVGRDARDLIPSESEKTAGNTYAQLRENPGSFVKLEDRVKHRNGEWRSVEATITNLLHDDSVKGFVVNVRDVSERKSFERELEHQVLHDSLTGLPNRALLVDRLEQALARARRSPHEVGLLFLDLDRFKYVNDSRGHVSGDALLRLVGTRLRGVMRASDTVARFGGDEFVVLVEESASTEGLLAAVEKICTALRSPFVLDGIETFITASIGIASSQAGREDPNELIRDADAAMYRAKDQGRDRYEVFDPSIHSRAVGHLEITNALRAALVEDQFELHYQSIVDLRTGGVLGFEALLRWRQPDGTVSLPDNLVGIAEETGLIVPIGAWVIEEACRQSAEWARLAGREQGPGIGINLSVRQLRERDLVENVARIAKRHGVNPHALTFEITESVLADDATTIGALEALRLLGAQLVIDDFGMGYSSLGYLKQLPVVAVKIDRTFVDGLGDHDEDMAIVTAIVGLARGLGLSVVAEGVETAQQVEQLVALGVEVGQGFLFGHPAPAEAWTDAVCR